MATVTSLSLSLSLFLFGIDYTSSGPFRSMKSFGVNLKINLLSFALFINGYEQTKSDRFCYFSFSFVLLVSEGSNLSELICKPNFLSFHCY